MKTPNQVKRLLWAVVAVIVLTWTACYPPEFRDIEQPGSAEYNDTFGVDISVLKLQSEYGPDSIFSRIGMALPTEWAMMLENRGSTNYRLVFGIRLPGGWSVADNIPFTGDDEGIFSYSDSLTQLMTGYYPPDTGYYWWVSETPETMNVSMGVIYFTPVITTDTSRGNFYLDYSLGYRDGDYLEIQASTSFNHLITVGLPDTVHVTTVAESGPGSIRAAIDSVSQGGTILFDLLFPATIVLSSPVEIYKSVNITGPSNGSLSFSGNDSCTVFNVPDYKRLGLSHVKVTDGNSYQGGGIVLGWHSEGILSE